MSGLILWGVGSAVGFNVLVLCKCYLKLLFLVILYVVIKRVDFCVTGFKQEIIETYIYLKGFVKLYSVRIFYKDFLPK